MGYALMVSRTLTIPGRMVRREPSARLLVVSPAGYCPPAGGASPISPGPCSSGAIADLGRRAKLGSAGSRYRRRSGKLSSPLAASRGAPEFRARLALLSMSAPMRKPLKFLGGWLLLSLPFGILVGKFIKAGRGPSAPGEEEG